MKRLIIDAIGNYIIFTPLVLALNAWGWSLQAVIVFCLMSIPTVFVGARVYTLFLKHIWYPLWKEEF